MWNCAWVWQMVAISCGYQLWRGFILYGQRLEWSPRPLPRRVLTQVLIIWTVLLTQENVHTSSVSHNFVTWTTTHMQPDFSGMNASQMLLYKFECHRFASKSYKGIQNGRIQVLHANSYCQQCTNKCIWGMLAVIKWASMNWLFGVSCVLLANSPCIIP